MYTVSSKLYEEIVARLCESIGRGGYYSGSIAVVDGDVDCRLTTSAVVVRCHTPLPEGDCDYVGDLIPVWWEFTTSRCGEELLNDFSFNALREFIC